MRMIPYFPGPGGNKPQPVVLHSGGPQPLLLGSNDCVPAGLSPRRCLWSMIVDEGEPPCCPGHQGLDDHAAVRVMDLGRSLAAVSCDWYWCDRAKQAHGRRDDFISPLLIPVQQAAEVANLEPLFDVVEPMPATQVATELQALKHRLARRTVPTHLHVAVLVEELPIVIAWPAQSS